MPDLYIYIYMYMCVWIYVIHVNSFYICIVFFLLSRVSLSSLHENSNRQGQLI